MILAANVNNSHISFGVFKDGKECVVLHDFKISTGIEKTSDEYVVTVRNILDHSDVALDAFSGAIISSVIPSLTDVIAQTIYKLIGIRPMIIGPGVKTGVPIKIDNPSELGADLVANASAVVSENKTNGALSQASIILDMGAATTMFAINSFGEYIGGCIFSGVRMSLDSLHGKTAQLPSVSASLPEKAIGKNSQDSLRSGVLLGTAMMIDGFVSRFEKEMKCRLGEARLFATGEYAENVLSACSHKFKYDPLLTLKGLYYIYSRNN